MTADGFRRMALGLGGAIESAHMGHPDFRVGGRIFATLGYPDRRCGVVMLTPDQQRQLIHAHPSALAPVKGAWGKHGATVVTLAEADEEALGEALTQAWRNRAQAPAAPARPTAKARPRAKAVKAAAGGRRRIAR